jgi:GTP-binding protein HflX
LATDAGPPQAVLFGVWPQGGPPEAAFEELAGLCDTAGIEVVGTMPQTRSSPTSALYLGKGKAGELGELCAACDATLAICDAELTPVQGRNLEHAIGRRVLDRSELILAIFAARARTKQARLQVELAQRSYQLPRLRRLWTHLDRERGGKGFLGGMGEKQIDVDRRLLEDRIHALRQRLREIEARKQREIQSRRSQFLVSLVGYTNAGKSTLMNLLTDAGVLQEDRLFSTLDTRTRRWELGEGRFVLLSDTVGFIRDLPHQLVASFHATLAEALEADLLLLVVDASHPHAEQRLQTVLDVLDQIGATGKDRLLVLNKIDQLDDRSSMLVFHSRFPDAVAVSAKTGEGREELITRVGQRLAAAAAEITLRVPHALSNLHSEIHALVTVLDVAYEADAAYFRVLATAGVLRRLEARGIVRASP